ncbi:uncharacterized protein LOC126835377 [Adelges cooleyi]|uniref:uncharacterized protein LOC126835377 n=1 Tax=Adelges cooleyi TaxID=133065 RepID=UPI00218098C8|nr:uncharacterized protein LOC126835377 [Adelges cooleyi]
MDLFMYALGLICLLSTVALKTEQASNNKKATVKRKVVYDETFVRTLNYIPSVRNLVKQVFDDNDVKYLSGNGIFLNEEVEIKLEIKMLSLKCIYGRVVDAMIDHLTNVVLDGPDGRYFGETDLLVNKYKTAMTKMLSALYLGKTVADQWMWEVHAWLRRLSPDKPSKPEFLSEKFFEQRLKTKVDPFVNSCSLSDDMGPAVPLWVADKMYFTVDGLDLFDDQRLLPMYRLSDKFPMFRLFLGDLSYNTNTLFKPLNGINWKNAEKTMTAQLAVLQSKWTTEPYLFDGYHGIVKKTIEATSLYYTLIHFMAFKADKKSTSAGSLAVQPTGTSSWGQIFEPLTSSVNILALENDDFYKKLMSYQCDPAKSVGKHGTFDDCVKSLRNKLNKTLKSIGVTSLKKKHLTDSVKVLLSKGNVKENTDSFVSYTASIRTAMNPIDFHVVDYFKSSQTENWNDKLIQYFKTPFKKEIQ